MLLQVYNVRQAKTDIDAVYSMGLFDDVNILPQPAEDSTLEQPKVGACTRYDSLQMTHALCCITRALKEPYPLHIEFGNITEPVRRAAP